MEAGAKTALSFLLHCILGSGIACFLTGTYRRGSLPGVSPLYVIGRERPW